ncbi:hypothetical protein PG614_02900 [Riemerella anatipestifer]|nr:hypothetical protein [Riemerella anatipestifer]MDY3532555.1 hypothetical protein [Riemerella anatipestifer]MDY3534890.1 hypothetical protein [Riemerella anatipestifer]
MKLKYISVICFLAGVTAYGQVKVNQTISIEGKSNAFLDASENTESKPNSIGRGLLFPQTDLSTFKLDINAADGVNYPTYFDGMIVYNTKEGGKTSDTNIQVTDNLQKGFYYFSNPTGKTNGNITNGKWIKLSDTQANDQLWAQKTTTSSIDTYLKPANETNVDFLYKKTNPNVRALVLKMKNNDGTAAGESLWLPNPNGVAPDYGFKKSFSSDILPLSLPASNTIWAPEYTFEETDITVNGSHTNTIASNIRNYRGSNSVITINPDVTALGDVMGVRGIVELGIETSSQSNSSNVSTVTTTTANSIMGGTFGATSFSVGKANTIRGTYIFSNSYQGGEAGRMNALNTSTKMRRGGKADVMEGITNEVYTQLADNGSYASSTVGAVAGLRNMVFVNDNTTVINGGASARFDLTLGNNTTSPTYSGLFSMLRLQGNAQVGRLYGSRLYTDIATTAQVTDMYGIYLDNVKAGTDKNYALYTNEGKVRFGDNVGIGVDAPVEKLEVAGKVKATAFIGTNGAAIFPDYVFQKYYTGTSSIKADYSFKTLSQVEDFVKTNGHLPGYQSAAEIKKQGYVDLMATQFINVEKIEELYLHSIEQEKKIEAQQKQIEELKSLVQQLLNK